MSKLSGIMVFALALSLGACSSSTAPKLTVSGTWQGMSSIDIGLNLSLSQAGNTVSGTGSYLSVGTADQPLTVTGNVSGKDVSLTLTFLNAESLLYKGTLVNDASISGNLSGAAFGSASLALNLSRVGQ